MSQSETTSGDRPCQGLRRDGSPCRARALPGRAHCWAHDPALAERRRTAHAAGGRNKSNSARVQRLVPLTLRPVVHKLIGAIDEVHTGRLDPKVAGAMATLAGAVSRLYEIAELEQRLAALEKEGDRGEDAG